MLESLQSNFPLNESWTEGISWNKPKGGFFLTMTLPFDIDPWLLKECIEKYGVVFCPMSFFCLNPKRGEGQIRLTFSNLSKEKIRESIKRLACFVKDKL